MPILAQSTLKMTLDLQPEIELKTSRSGGKGGQHVNKVETKVEARFHIANSKLLTQDQKEKLLQKLQHTLSHSGHVILTCGEARTQLENKEKVIQKMNRLLNLALVEQKKRLKTKIPNAVIEKRLASKRRNSEIKSLRRKLA
jgi:ribosome-associated protein